MVYSIGLSLVFGMMELVILGFGSWTAYQMGYNILGVSFAVIIVLHYLVSYDRILWPLSQ